MKALIIEDETAAALNLEAILKQVAPGVEIIGTLESVEESVEWLRANPQPDLLFMDIHLADGDSFRIFDAVEFTAPVVFTTAYDQYALEAFRVNSIDYLLKPISYADFLTAANKAFEWFELKRRSVGKPSPAEAGPGSIFVKTEYRLRQIELDKILYIEGLKDYVKIYVEDEPRPVLSLISLKTLEEQLPAERFVRVHRSYIVQPSKIRIIERGRIVFGKTYIPVSDGYKEAFYAFLEARSLMPKSDK